MKSVNKVILIGNLGKDPEGKFTPPNFELAMARKDLRLMIDEAARHGEKDKDAESKDKESKDKTHTVKLGVLRNKSEISLNVEVPAPATTTRHIIARRTNI